MFGKSLGLCEDMEYSDWLSQLFVSIWLAGASRALQYFPLLFRLATMMIPKHIQDSIDSSYQNTVDKVNKRLEMKTERPDMLGLMLKHKEEGAEMTMDELYANADLLMIAGTETTATSLCGLTWHLLNNKPVLDRLTKEIREAFTSIDDITMESLPKLPVSVAIASCHPLYKKKKTNQKLPTVPICLPGRRHENVPCCPRRYQKNHSFHWRNNRRPLHPSKRKLPSLIML